MKTEEYVLSGINMTNIQYVYTQVIWMIALILLWPE